MKKAKYLRRIGVDILKNLKKTRIGGNNMKKNFGKNMIQLQIKIHKDKNQKNSR